jgi:hypothetical protein
MKCRLSTRASALMLGLWIALAPAGLAVPAMAMLHHAEMSAGMDGCDPCPGTDMTAETCAFICLSAPFYTVPSESASLLEQPDTGRRRAADSSASGLIRAPDPAPPKFRLPS